MKLLPCSDSVVLGLRLCMCAVVLVERNLTVKHHSKLNVNN